MRSGYYWRRREMWMAPAVVLETRVLPSKVLAATRFLTSINLILYSMFLSLVP